MSLAAIEADFRALLLQREPGGAFANVARARVYRQLVRGSLLGTLRRACPHALRLHAQAFEELAARFLEESPPTTRLLRDVPGQFTAWLMQQDPSTTLPAAHSGAFAELCHYEALEIEVTLSETAQHPVTPLRDDAVFQLDPSARLAIYRHPVQRVTSSSTALPAASSQPVVLLCFQRAEQLVVDVVSPALGKLLLLLGAGEALGPALQVLIEEGAAGGVVVDVDRLRAELVDLQCRGALGIAEPAAVSAAE